MLDVFLHDAVLLLAFGLAVVTLSHWLRLPAIIGFLLTGLLIGPSALGLVDDIHQVEAFAEIGVVFLLFSLGLEFSPDRLRDVRRPFFVAGPLQLVLTIVLAGALGRVLGLELRPAVFFAFLVSLSSTAVVLRLYLDRRELGSPAGRSVLGILLFQDFLLVPMIAVTPLLGGTAEASLGRVLLQFGIGLAVVAVVFGVARRLTPRLLDHLARTRIREILVLTALLACLGLAWLTEHLGFSLALGAFLAGILLSESRFSHQIAADVGPFRDVFNSVFFISIGMLLDLRVVAENAPMVVGLAAAIVALKALGTGLAMRAISAEGRIVTTVALGLAQVGEFSFVLLGLGQKHGLIAPPLVQIFLAAAVLTLLATPALVAIAPRLGRGWVGRLPALPESPPAVLEQHVLIVGFGHAGSNLARVLREANIGYQIVEIDTEVARAAELAGEPILVGDAARREILEHAGVERARVAVFALSDDWAANAGIRQARALNPRLSIIARARTVAEIEPLHAAGADEVIAEQFETTIEIYTRVLLRYRVPGNVIRAQTRLLRGDDYRMLRSPSLSGALPEAVLAALAAGATEVFQVRAGSRAAGRSLAELGLREATGALVIALVRENRALPNPDPGLPLAPLDCLVLLGSHRQLDDAFAWLEGDAPARPIES